MTRSSSAAGVALPRRPSSGGSSSMGTAAASSVSSVPPLPSAPPPALPLPRGGRGGRPSSKFGTVNYSVDEMRRLNAKVRAVLPLAGEDWLHVAYQFNYLRPESIPYREVESLKRKFKKMYCSRASAASGGKLPDYIAEAKELRKLINQRTEKASAATSTPASEDGTDGDTGAQRLRRSSSHSSNGSSRSPASKPGVPTALGSTDDAVTVANNEDELLRAPAEALADGSSSYMPQQLLLSTETESEAARRKQSQQHSLELVGTSTALKETDTEAEAARDISFKLRQMEEEYHHAMESKRPSSTASDKDASGSTEPHSTSALESTSVASTMQPPGLASGSWAASGVNSTSGIISMLRHSIERKRRTVEEQMLSESMRVRRERKKRKMEQVLLSIHQEQREREGAAGAGVAAESAVNVAPTTPGSTPPPAYSSHPPSSPDRQSQLMSPFAAASSSTSPPTFFPAAGTPTLQDPSSLGLMELLLQFMTAQQLESAQRTEVEQARREQERREREQRRRHKERQRRQEHRELMLAMAALLGGRFPDALSHHLTDPNQNEVGNESFRPVEASTTTSSTDHQAAEGVEADVNTVQAPDQEQELDVEDAANTLLQ